jgi:hypothetical protein
MLLDDQFWRKGESFMKKITSMLLTLSLMGLILVPVAQAKERYPNIDKAIMALKAAERDLNRAPHDFGGHKADAMAACETAIRQLQLAKQFKNEENALKRNERQQGR